jgi:16S rRNA (cytosine967-C5)-methyltransferase
MPATRELALTALNEIWARGKKPKDAIEEMAGILDERERSFLMELVYGVLRHRDILDWSLKDFLKKPAGLGIASRNNLRLAVYQILFTRVPQRAAVHEAVEMEKSRGRPGVVNAVLRNLLRRPESERMNLDTVKKEGPVRYISLLTSHPEWLIRRWISRFGEAETLELARADNAVPPLTIRVNTLRSSRDRTIAELGEIGIRGKATGFSPDGIKLKDFHLLRMLSAFRDSIVVQDEAAQLITYLAEPQPGERVLDACAAPGGKTTHLAQLMRDEGEIVAVDSDESRLTRLKENISNLGFKCVKVVKGDVRDLADAGRSLFDRILLDAPCSALGVIRRNPDIKYRHSRKDMMKFKSTQADMLRSVSRFLKPGGFLIYSVCSTEPEEGEEVVKEFLKDSRDFYIIDAVSPFLKSFVKDGFFRTYPHISDMDGFFGAKLCKKA